MARRHAMRREKGRETKTESEQKRAAGSVFSPLLCSSIFAWECRFNLWERKSWNFPGDLWLILTEDSSGRHRFLIYPEGHLGKDYCHDAWDVCLNHEVAHFPFQVEIDSHHHVFTWKTAGNRKQFFNFFVYITMHPETSFINQSDQFQPWLSPKALSVLPRSMQKKKNTTYDSFLVLFKSLFLTQKSAKKKVCSLNRHLIHLRYKKYYTTVNSSPVIWLVEQCTKNAYISYNCTGMFHSVSHSDHLCPAHTVKFPLSSSIRLQQCYIISEYFTGI